MLEIVDAEISERIRRFLLHNKMQNKKLYFQVNYYEKRKKIICSIYEGLKE